MKLDVQFGTPQLSVGSSNGELQSVANSNPITVQLGTPQMGVGFGNTQLEVGAENPKIIVPYDEVFWATYGTTTSADIETAYQARKLCLCNYNGTTYYLGVRSSATKHKFFRIDDHIDSSNNMVVDEGLQCSNSKWSTLYTGIYIPQVATSTPSDLGTAAIGLSSKYAKEDHVHKMPSASDVGAYSKPSDGIPSTDLANTYAGAAVAGGVANGTQSIPYGEVDDTSTSTAFTATVPGITELKDGTCILLKNGVVTSASGFTIDINGLGAKPAYSNMATGNSVTPTNPTRETTIFNINYTMLFVYSTTLVTDGAWICYRGYNSDTNTIAYQIRKNNTAIPTAIRSRYYRLFFTSSDNVHWEPANTGYDNSATSKKTVNTRPINPFAPIAYTSASTNYTAGTNIAAGTLWYQYAFALGYSFNTEGKALTLTFPAPVYVKCAPQTDGSAVIDSTTPYVQTLPNTADGKIYIYLGMAYSATNIELHTAHPVYYHNGTGIRIWTGG